jgi:hypothetical protein
VQITVDDREYQGRGQAGQTVRELAEELCGDQHSRDARLVIRLSCDGHPVQPARLEEVLQSTVESFATLEFQTVSVREQVSCTLGQAIEVFQQTDSLRNEIADLLNQGRNEAAMASLQKLLDIFKQVQQTTLLSSQLLGVELDSVRIDGKGLAEVLAVIKERLTDLRNGMEAQDLVMVADLLRYEFSQPLEIWQAILTELHGAAAA